MKTDFPKLLACILGCEAAGLLGAVATFPAIGTWYAALAKPAFTPPSWVFGPAWTVLYLLMGVALYLVLMKGFEKSGVKAAVYLFGLQLIINVVWSFLFFGMKSPFYGLVCIVLLWLAILLTIIKFRKISPVAAWLMVPYLAWVTFASVLNYYVWVLN